ncbi:MAG: MFS transporter [Fibrobacter sp.]|nr:MFS transporter [Fibrobacter sp.]
MANDKKQIFAWCLYDWANSAFALTVMAGFFPVFFKTFWSAGVEPTISTARLGFGNAVAGLIVAVLSPLMGAVADAGRAKKKFLVFFMIVGVSSSGILFFIGQGQWIAALVIFAIASVAYNSGNLFYDSLLVDICEKDSMDMVSARGYGIGYLGCGVLFLFNVMMVSYPEAFGLNSVADAVRISFLTAALWWLVFSQPIILFVKEKIYSETTGFLPILRGSLQNLRQTTRKILDNPTLLLFLISYWLYIDGLNTFVLMSVDFGMAIGITTKSLMIALICVQFVAFPSSLLFGYFSRKVGAFVMILVGLGIYILVSGVGSIILKTELHFIILAALSGLAQGGIQALSRSYYAKMIPASESAEYFGFYNVMSRFAVIIGPAVVGIVAYVTHKAGVESTLASRIGMSSVSVLFLAGALLLIWAEMRKKWVAGVN